MAIIRVDLREIVSDRHWPGRNVNRMTITKITPIEYEIPEYILAGEHDHTESYAGDNGTQFELTNREEQP